MAALTADRPTPRRVQQDVVLPVAANTKIYAGALVVMNTSSGFAAPGSVATTLRGVGVAQAQADNTGGANGAINVNVARGCWRFANSSSTDQITLADVGADCYIVDDQTVAKTNGSATRSVAGKVRDVDAQGVWVEFN